MEETVQSFAKGLDVLRSFSGRSSQTITAVSERTGMTRAAARRFLRTLCISGMATTDGKHFKLTPAVLELAQAYLSGTSEEQAVQDMLAQITRQTGNAATAAVLEGDEIVFIAQVTPPGRSPPAGISKGSRLPAHATSLGQALLARMSEQDLAKHLKSAKLARLTEHTLTTRKALAARLEDVRAQGYALVSDEYAIGLRSIAVAIGGTSGSGVAISTPLESGATNEAAQISATLPVLKRVARQMQGSGLF